MNFRKLFNPLAVTRKIKRLIYIKRSRQICYNSTGTNDEATLSVNNNIIYFQEHDLGNITSAISLTNNLLKEEIITFATTLIEKKLIMLNHKFDFSGGDIIWDYDPVTGTRWGDECSFDIIYRGPHRLSDIKLPWELAKMQYLFILGKAFTFTEDKRYSDEIVSQINSWIDNNPPFKGIHWISALEVGMRVVSFIMVFPFIKENIGSLFLTQYLNSIFSQTVFIEDNLTEHKYANNHLIGEAFTLVIAGLFLDSRKSSKWYRKGCRILTEQIKKQVYPDGINKEQSLNYHRFTLDYYYLFIIIHRQNSLDYPSVIDEYTEKMTEFIMYSLMPDGSAPAFGDADDDRAIYVNNSCGNDYQSLLALGAVLFNRADFKYKAENVPEEVFWLLGPDGYKKYNGITAVSPESTSISYAEGGYYIMRSDWSRNADYLIFDCGPLGHGPAGHGHADALSFQLCSDGINYLVDPGTYSYNLDYDWRDYFRSTPAHNTVTVDGLNQSEINDRMSWKIFADSKANMWLSTEWFDLVDGEHDGYQRLNDPVKHRRIIFFNKRDYWIIADLLECSSEHTFDFHLHIHPDCVPVPDFENQRLEVRSKNNKKISVDFINDETCSASLKIFKGDEDTKLGWYSESYGTKKPCNTLRVRKQSSGSTKFITLISNKDVKGDIRIGENNTLMCSVRNPVNGRTDIIYYSLLFPAMVKDNTITFNGKCLYIRKADEEVELIYATEFRELTIESEVKIYSDKAIQCFKASEKIYNITLTDGKVEGLEIFDSQNRKLFINEREYVIKNNSPVPLN